MIEKFLILIMSIFLILAAGSANIYPIYLQNLIEKFGFTINEMNLYGSIVTLATLIGFPISIIYDSYGPKFSCFIGTVLLSGGYFLLHCLFKYEFFSNINIYPLYFLGFIIGQGYSLLYTTAITTNLKNFRFKQNSSIIGTLVANLAISPSIFTTYRQLNLDITEDNFYLYFSIFLFFIGFFTFIIINNINFPYPEDSILKKYQKHKEKRILNLLMLYSLINIGVFVFGVLYNYFTNTYSFPLILIYPILQLLTFLIVLLEQFGFFDKLYFPEFKQKVELISKKQIEMSIMNKKSERNIIKTKSTYYKKEYEFNEALKSPKLILLFIALFFGLGSTLSNVSNINFILKSLTYKIHYSGMNKGLISIYKSKELFFFFFLYFNLNSLTRISSSIFLDYLIKNNKFIYFFLMFSFFGFISQFLGISMNKKLLYITIALAGATHGGYMTFLPIFVKNEFGLKNMGKILGTITTGAGIGSLTIGEIVFSLPYNKYAQLEGNIQCIGAHCFRKSFIITTIFFGINIIISIILIAISNKK